MKDLLQSLTSLSEGETKDTKTGRVHKGSYGSEYETDREGNEKKKEAPAVKKGRGRPKKDGGEEGSKFDSSALSSVFGGKKPSSKVGTVSKKHSLKEYMESVEDTKNAEAVMEGMFGSVNHSSVAANLGKLAKVIKSVQTPEQFAVAQKYAQRMSGTIQQHQHAGMGFGPGLRANIQVSRAIQDDLKRKAAELGIEYQPLEEAGEPITVAPAQQNTQVIQQGDKTLGTVTNPQLAQQIKQAMSKGEMSIAGLEDDGMNESKKSKPDFLDVDKDSDKKEPFKKAVKDKEEKEKVSEGRDHLSSQYLDEEIAKILAREKPGMATVKSNDEFYSAIYHELIQQGLTPRAARGKLADEDFISDVASAYAHYQANPSLDEGTIEDFTQHALAEPTQSFTKTGTSMAQPRGTPTTANRPVQDPTPWGTDPIAAATDRAFNFVSSLGKGTKFTKESTDMKDIQLEGWEKQLQGLLNEGITVSSSQGQQGAPNSVSVTATEGDADELMSVLRNAGIGGFGAEKPAPEIGYGVTQGGEEDFDGTGTEPQPSPDVVGDDGDMLSMLKKMAGIEGGQDAEVVAVSGGDEEGGEEQADGQDYKDEEDSDDTALQPADGEEDGDKEETDEGAVGQAVGTAVGRVAGAELGPVGSAVGGAVGGAIGDAIGGEDDVEEGNAFGQEVRQKKSDNIPDSQQSIKTGGQNLPVKEESCGSCGHAPCECDDDKVEESFANSANDPAEAEFAKLKALLSMGNDMHKMKQSQAMGNPIRVAESDSLAQWRKLSGIK